MHRFDAYYSTIYSRGIRWLPSPVVCQMHVSMESEIVRVVSLRKTVISYIVRLKIQSIFRVEQICTFLFSASKSLSNHSYFLRCLNLKLLNYWNFFSHLYKSHSYFTFTFVAKISPCRTVSTKIRVYFLHSLILIYTLHSPQKVTPSNLQGYTCFNDLE